MQENEVDRGIHKYRDRQTERTTQKEIVSCWPVESLDPGLYP